MGPISDVLLEGFQTQASNRLAPIKLQRRVGPALTRGEPVHATAGVVNPCLQHSGALQMTGFMPQRKHGILFRL